MYKSPFGVSGSWCKNVLLQHKHTGFSWRWERLYSVCASGSHAHPVFQVYFQIALIDGCLLLQFSPKLFDREMKDEQTQCKGVFSILVLSLYIEDFPGNICAIWWRPNRCLDLKWWFRTGSLPKWHQFRFGTNFQVLSMGNTPTSPGFEFFFPSWILQFKSRVFAV